jgi:large subunit ribosomal protein L31
MKADIHPKYQNVVFQDVSSNFAILTRSTMTSKETIKWEDGKDYPLVKVEISSQSHPFYTGKHKVMDAGGRVDKFRRRYGAKPTPKRTAILVCTPVTDLPTGGESERVRCRIERPHARSAVRSQSLTTSARRYDRHLAVATSRVCDNVPANACAIIRRCRQCARTDAGADYAGAEASAMPGALAVLLDHDRRSRRVRSKRCADRFRVEQSRRPCRSSRAVSAIRRSTSASSTRTPATSLTIRDSCPRPRAAARSRSSTATGVLLYRGYPIEQLAKQSSFLEVAYLLINGDCRARPSSRSSRTKSRITR